MIYDIRLNISHHYDQPAGNGRHLIRVLPRDLFGRQIVLYHSLELLPPPEERFDSTDFFGNATTSVSHIDPHSDMVVRMQARVELIPPGTWLDLSPDINRLRHEWQNYRALDADSPLHYLGPSPRVSPNSEIAYFAQDAFDPSASVAENVIRLGRAIYDEMTFDSDATTVDTNAADAFRLRKGVCQDFTHIMILALHALGIPAGYVSGYLRTLPPEGGVKLEGADAMHAWVRAWCGMDHGWIEYDPTNAARAGADHVVAGFGRDYSDVSPIIGHLRSSGAQTNDQAVDVAVVA